jgi:hypothetical protein
MWWTLINSNATARNFNNNQQSILIYSKCGVSSVISCNLCKYSIYIHSNFNQHQYSPLCIRALGKPLKPSCTIQVQTGPNSGPDIKFQSPLGPEADRVTIKSVPGVSTSPRDMRATNRWHIVYRVGIRWLSRPTTVTEWSTIHHPPL